MQQILLQQISVKEKEDTIFPDRKRFYYFARGSLYESETWMTKSLNRKLISEQQKKEYSNLINQCRKMINSYVLKIKQRL
ncbi:MAG: four helix bundle protein [Bacteroidales bacterium]|nr:four helix bundle protein [Bacteroidales bacterium]